MALILEFFSCEKVSLSVSEATSQLIVALRVLCAIDVPIKRHCGHAVRTSVSVTGHAVRTSVSVTSHAVKTSVSVTSHAVRTSVSVTSHAVGTSVSVTSHAVGTSVSVTNQSCIENQSSVEIPHADMDQSCTHPAAVVEPCSAGDSLHELSLAVTALATCGDGTCRLR